ncbi:MFS transporter [archaeon]|jgi:MFS family permease|nr:MFS transporter [archaeon]MBT6182481.1 MFS transporter [archaeon]MBT6606631.1 MFS transporter [archaeon]MBT7251874.1 MFS transporter [archaeon]MBT7660554.1 MFS transporter [archaeon]
MRIRKDKKKIAEKVEDAKKVSVREGGYYAIASNMGAAYFTPFALLLQATASQIGILNAVMHLIPSILQLKTSRLIEKYSRKKIVLRSIIFQTMLWIPLILTGVLFYFNTAHMIPLLIILVGIYFGLGGIAHIAWFSWMGSLVGEHERGKYFSRRNRVLYISGIISIILAAVILEFFKKQGIIQGNELGYTIVGFALLFFIAFLARMWTIHLFRKQYDPKIRIRKKDYFSFKDFLKTSSKTAFGRFTIFRGFFSVAIGVASPFYAVYMLRDLGFSYVWFVAIVVSTMLFDILFLPIQGKISDKFGNIRLMRICAHLFFLVPLLWYFSSFIQNDLLTKLYLIFVPSMIAGFVSSGYMLATDNYLLDAVKPRKRSYATTYVNLIVGFSAFTGALIGSFIAWVEPEFMSPILLIFLISTLLRFFVGFLGISHLSEVRSVSKFKNGFLIKEFKPAKEINRELHNFDNFVKKMQPYV